VIAFDEPTFGQDADSAAEILKLLDELNARGTTILVVTHDLQLVVDHATAMVVLRDGAVVADGPVTEVIGSPALAAAGLRPPPLCAAVADLGDDSPLARLNRLDRVGWADVSTEAV